MPTKRRVLVVDDDSDIRELLAQYLEDRFDVTVASDGADAIEAVTDGGAQVDAVVADLEMPRMDGAALTEALRQRGLDVPVLIMSGTPEARRRARQVHAEFLPKPFDVNQLEQRIERLLRGS